MQAPLRRIAKSRSGRREAPAIGTLQGAAGGGVDTEGAQELLDRIDEVLGEADSGEHAS